jgi:hypothetical protein
MVNIIKKILTKPQNTIEFDSEEESEFYAWCEEARRHEYIESFTYHPESYELTPRASMIVQKQLKTKVKEVEKFLFHPHSYTPDFHIIPTPKMNEVKHGLLTTGDTYLIDVKGTFSRFHDEKSFSINQKLLFYRYNLIVNKVIPAKFFPKTWVPVSCRLTKTGKVRKPYKNCQTVDQLS